MRWSLILVCLLAACNTPSPAFLGVAPKTVTVEGSTYRVYVKQDRVQIIRTNSEWGTRGQADRKMRRAVQQATGCVVDGAFKGDEVVAEATLDCGSR